MLAFVAGMVPAPGEAPAEWWDNTGYRETVQRGAGGDAGATGGDDPSVTFYHDVPRALAEEAMSKERGESRTAYDSPGPLPA